jgi:hypothetical protein
MYSDAAFYRTTAELRNVKLALELFASIGRDLEDIEARLYSLCGINRLDQHVYFLGPSGSYAISKGSG